MAVQIGHEWLMQSQLGEKIGVSAGIRSVCHFGDRLIRAKVVYRTIDRSIDFRAELLEVAEVKSSMIYFGLFISLFYIFGFGLLGASFWSAWQSTRAGYWPTTPGTIQDVDIAENSDGDGDPTYEVKVEYSYEVLGTKYDGSRLAFGYAGSSGREAHEEIRERLQKANVVAVRYNPADPSVSCLSYGIHRSIQIIFVFALTWLLFVFGFTLLFWLSSLPDSELLRNLSVQ